MWFTVYAHSDMPSIIFPWPGAIAWPIAKYIGLNIDCYRFNLEVTSQVTWASHRTTLGLSSVSILMEKRFTLFICQDILGKMEHSIYYKYLYTAKCCAALIVSL